MVSLLQDGPAYVHLFVSILRDIFKEETVEYVLALIYEMLSGKQKHEDISVFPFIHFRYRLKLVHQLSASKPSASSFIP